MDDDFIIAAYLTIADTLQELGHHSHRLAKVSDAEVVTVAVAAAKFFRNHQGIVRLTAAKQQRVRLPNHERCQPVQTPPLPS